MVIISKELEIESYLECAPGRWRLFSTEREEKEGIPWAGLRSLDRSHIFFSLGQHLHKGRSLGGLWEFWDVRAPLTWTLNFSGFKLHCFSLKSTTIMVGSHQMPPEMSFRCAVNQIWPISFRSQLFRICAICVSEHFNGASSHLQLLTLRILPFFTVQFYRLLGVMLRLVILPQQAKRKCQKLALLLFRRVYFLFL